MMAYARLRREVAAAGILDRDPRSYTALIVVIVVGLAGSLLQLWRVPASAALVAWALVFAVFAVQLCGIVHDAGHRAIVRSPTGNTLIGEVACAFLAMGFQVWRQEHNRHHAFTNAEDEDPDLRIPLHAFTRRRFADQRGVWRWLRRYQAWLFYPLRVLVVFSRRLVSIPYFRTQSVTLRLAGAVAVWAVGMVCWFGLPFLFFPLPKALLLFAVVHPAMGFYLSTIFAPNHKGMPQIPTGTTISFLEQQIRTSRNITPGLITDLLYIGLHYQIEHHLFPTCPRHKLPQLTPYVVALCQDLDLPYTQVGILTAHRSILAALARVAAAAG